MKLSSIIFVIFSLIGSMVVSYQGTKGQKFLKMLPLIILYSATVALIVSLIAMYE